MPTPVSTARQCLTEEAAAALDDAVAVARRRSHAQTTSLHAVSALLALPSSTLREACARARSSAYSPRLQFRALELCVGVSLDRLATSKAQEEPPISNSLMAAIKRSQANQRRHPETFHLYQQLQYHNSSNFQNNSNSSSPPSISTVKVELRHFILSILDDPIVSRVFGEAGFRSCDIKLAILNPPTISRFAKTRCPPLFLCNFSDLELSKRGFSFPFSGVFDTESVNENSRRIGEVLVKKTGKNPLLVGVCANDALNEFLDSVQKGKSGVLPKDIDGLNLVRVEKEISEFLDRAGSEEMLGLKFKEVDDLIEGFKGTGLVVNYGDLKAFVDDGKSVEEMANYVVSRLSKLVKVHCGKLWLIGASSSYDTYMKFLTRFPSIEKDWDLHLLPITSSRPPAGVHSKSGLMGSFVPFGGFFPSTSDFESTWSKKKQSTGCCNICNEKYEQEAAIVLKGGATVSVADQCSSNLSSWLQMAESEKGKHLGTKEASDDQIVLNARLMGLQKKWNEICQRLHHFSSIQQTVSSAKSQVSNIDAFQFTSARSESGNTSLLLDERKLADPKSCLPSDLQHVPLLTPNVLKPVPSLAGVDSRADVPVQGLRIGNFWNSYGVSNFSLPLDHTTASSITSVTTDLGLGTIYASAGEEPSKTKFQEHKTCLPKFSQGSVSADTSCGNVSNQIGQSYSSPVPQSGNQSDRNDFKYLLKVLSEKVSWQDGAVYTISQTVTSCKNGLGRRHGSSKGNIWLIFHGPDKVGKRRIAASLADATFGNKQNLFLVDFGSVENVSRSNTLFDRQDLKSNDRNFRGKTMVDYVAEELSKKPQSLVVLLENIDKADLLVQHSLSRAMRTGRFPDSHGREICISNVIFVFTSRDTRVNKDVHSEKPATEYSEERILSARDFQMQLSIGRASGDGAKSSTNVTTASTKEHTTLISVGKRKSFDDIEFSTSKMLQKPKRAREVSRSCLDLNLPVEGMEEEDDNDYDDNDDNDYSGSENSKAWLEDLFDQVDENISFKPFDFDSLSQNILKDISLRFQQTVESNCSLEIDSEVMVQILAAAWLSDRKQSLDDWIENVLCRSFKEIQQRYHLSQNHVLKLIPCENLVENHAPGICLPAKVNVN